VIFLVAVSIAWRSDTVRQWICHRVPPHSKSERPSPEPTEAELPSASSGSVLPVAEPTGAELPSASSGSVLPVAEPVEAEPVEAEPVEGEEPFKRTDS
jgi:hypothetical protein